MARFDLTDEQWAKLQPLMPPERFGHRGHPYCDHRTVINGILWIIRTGSPWRDLPERYGSWKTCYDRLRRWTNNGLWQRILQCVQANQPDENNVEWHVCVLDSTSIKAHPHAAGAQPGGCELRERGTDPASLMVGIDSQHEDLTDEPLGVGHAGSDEADNVCLARGDPDPHCLIGQGVPDFLLLVSPPVAVEPHVDVVPKNLLHGREDGSPRPQ